MPCFASTSYPDVAITVTIFLYATWDMAYLLVWLERKASHNPEV